MRVPLQEEQAEAEKVWFGIIFPYFLGVVAGFALLILLIREITGVVELLILGSVACFASLPVFAVNGVAFRKARLSPRAYLLRGGTLAVGVALTVVGILNALWLFVSSHVG